MLRYQEESSSSESPDVDRSTPEATFRIVQKGIENNSFREVIASYSQQQKRFILFETIFAAGMVPEGATKEKLDALYEESKVDLDSLAGESTDANELLSKLIDRIDDLDVFLSKAQQTLSKFSNTRISPDPIRVTIDGKKAIVVHEITLYSYSRDADGNIVEDPSKHESKMFMREFGNDWLVCPKQEWSDPGFVWTVPD